MSTIYTVTVTFDTGIETRDVEWDDPPNEEAVLRVALSDMRVSSGHGRRGIVQSWSVTPKTSTKEMA